MTKRVKMAGLAIAVAATLGGLATPAFGTIKCTNPGGNTVNGQCNGTPLQYENPAGHAPGGWNK